MIRYLNPPYPQGRRCYLEGFLHWRIRLPLVYWTYHLNPLPFLKFGWFLCRKCQVCAINGCRHTNSREFIAISSSRVFKIKPFISCSTTGVVYLLQCPCGLHYVGRTKQALQVRPNEHINNIRKGFLKHSVSKHYALVHNKVPKNMIFLGIDGYTPSWRGVH